MTVDGSGVADADGAVEGLTCLDSDTVERLLEDMDALTNIMEELKKPASYKPSDIPSRNSKATIHVNCATGTRGATWSK
jgi:hypothetical protein